MGLTVAEPYPESFSEPCAEADLGQWFALTVKYQHERRVAEVLNASGVDIFLPLYRARQIESKSH